MDAKGYYELLKTKVEDGTLPSYDPNRGICMYRSAEGKQCAIGILIPDNVYTSNMEGKTLSQLLFEHPALEKYMPDVLSEQLSRVQAIHDQYGREMIQKKGSAQWDGNAFLQKVRKVLGIPEEEA